MLRRIFSGTAVLGVLLALLVAVVWLVEARGSGRWEPAVATLSLAAAFTGIFAERWAADAERRDRALAALAGEYRRNRAAFAVAQAEPTADRPRHPRVYPRFSAQATHDALRQAVFGADDDHELRGGLYEWVSVCDELNHRLDLTEMLVFGSPSLDRVRAFEDALHRAGGLLDRAAALNARLLTLVRPPDAPDPR